MQALLLKMAFERNSVEAYLDVLDNSINLGGKELTEHIKNQLNSCTDIIVIMGDKTKDSWWVPFEIGMSAQVDMPTATFLSGDVLLPSYLSYWPRLKTTEDVEAFLAEIKTKNKNIKELEKQTNYNNYTQRTYDNLNDLYANKKG